MNPLNWPEAISEQYTKVPKLIRFILHPILYAIAFPVMLVSFCAAYPIYKLVKAWDEFK